MCLRVTSFMKIQCSGWCVASSCFAFWNFLGFSFFFFNIFDLWLVESVDVSNISGDGGPTEYSNLPFAKHSV